MTNRLDALRALEKAVAECSIQPHDLDAFIPVFWMSANDALDAYRNNLESARRLCEEELPGWWWTVGTCRVSDDARVSPEGPESVMPDGTEWSVYTDIDQRPPGNPARALLRSIIRAMIAKEEAKCPAPTE